MYYECTCVQFQVAVVLYASSGESLLCPAAFFTFDRCQSIRRLRSAVLMCSRCVLGNEYSAFRWCVLCCLCTLKTFICRHHYCFFHFLSAFITTQTKTGSNIVLRKFIKKGIFRVVLVAKKEELDEDRIAFSLYIWTKDNRIMRTCRLDQTGSCGRCRVQVVSKIYQLPEMSFLSFLFRRNQPTTKGNEYRKIWRVIVLECN